MEKIGTYLTSTWSAVISAIILLGVYVLNPSAVETLRLKTFDYLIQTLETKTSEEIVLVEFGEKSVEKFGQWPFDRRDIAKIIQKLREHEAEVIAVPILMSEKDRAGGDAAFREAINNNGVVLAQTPTHKTANLMRSAVDLLVSVLLILMTMLIVGMVDYALWTSWEAVLRASASSPQYPKLTALFVVSLYLLILQVIFIHLFLLKRLEFGPMIRAIKSKLAKRE